MTVKRHQWRVQYTFQDRGTLMRNYLVFDQERRPSPSVIRKALGGDAEHATVEAFWHSFPACPETLKPKENDTSS